MRYEAETLALIRATGGKARELGHSYVSSAHLLLAMLTQPGNGGEILRGCGMRPGMVEDMTLVLYGKGTADLPLPQGFSSEMQRILRGAASEARDQEILCGNAAVPQRDRTG